MLGTTIAHVAATVNFCIGVKDFVPETCSWYADAIAYPRHGSHIADGKDD
jgi:hypothetical protein